MLEAKVKDGSGRNALVCLSLAAIHMWWKYKAHTVVHTNGAHAYLHSLIFLKYLEDSHVSLFESTAFTCLSSSLFVILFILINNI